MGLEEEERKQGLGMREGSGLGRRGRQWIRTSSTMVVDEDSFLCLSPFPRGRAGSLSMALAAEAVEEMLPAAAAMEEARQGMWSPRQPVLWRRRCWWRRQP
jgi:hypothetical protein